MIIAPIPPPPPPHELSAADTIVALPPPPPLDSSIYADPGEVQIFGRVSEPVDGEDDDVCIPSSQEKFNGKYNLMYSHLNMYRL
jgi:hypothetical protein